MLYLNSVSAVDGKKYIEREGYGFPFLSRHKEKCRKKVGEYQYATSSREVKKDGVLYDVCKSCGYEIKTHGYHEVTNLV